MIFYLVQKIPINYITFLAVFISFGILQGLFNEKVAKNEFEINKKYKAISIILSGVIGLLIYIKYGFSYHFYIYGILSIFLNIISFMDLAHGIILDEMNLILGIFAIFNMIVKQTYLDSIMGFLALGGIFFLIAIVTDGGIGGGDIKMIAPIGAIFGLYNGLYIIQYTFIYAGIVVIPLMIFKKFKNFKTSTTTLAQFIGIATISCILYWI